MNRTALFSKDIGLDKSNPKETEDRIMNQQSSKLQAKDLITVGIFTAIYFVIFLACAMLGFIPIFLLAMTFYGPVITGIPDRKSVV